jgi:hypothetical protein
MLILECSQGCYGRTDGRTDGSVTIEKLQLEAGRIVTGLPLFASRKSIYSETGWELLSDRRRVRRFSLLFPRQRSCEGI